MKHIYIPTLSAPIRLSQEQIEYATCCIESLGFKITFAKHAFKDMQTTSGSIQDRIDDLHEGFVNEQYDIIMPMRGGWNSNELLPYIDYDLISSHKKPFIGMSDMTTLCVNLYQKSHIQTIYGPMFTHFTKPRSQKANELFCQTMQNPIQVHSLSYTPHIDTNILKPGIMSGSLLGGNLAVLTWLLGTSYSLQITPGSILFLEDDHEANSHYWQLYLHHLKQAGYFEQIGGLLIGKPQDDGVFEPGRSIQEILLDVLKPYDFPIYTNLDFGHIPNQIPIPYGALYQENLAS